MGKRSNVCLRYTFAGATFFLSASQTAASIPSKFWGFAAGAIVGLSDAVNNFLFVGAGLAAEDTSISSTKLVIARKTSRRDEESGRELDSVTGGGNTEKSALLGNYECCYKAYIVQGLTLGVNVISAGVCRYYTYHSIRITLNDLCEGDIPEVAFWPLVMLSIFIAALKIILIDSYPTLRKIVKKFDNNPKAKPITARLLQGLQDPHLLALVREILMIEMVIADGASLFPLPEGVVRRRLGRCSEGFKSFESAMGGLSFFTIVASYPLGKKFDGHALLNNVEHALDKPLTERDIRVSQCQASLFKASIHYTCAMRGLAAVAFMAMAILILLDRFGFINHNDKPGDRSELTEMIAFLSSFGPALTVGIIMWIGNLQTEAGAAIDAIKIDDRASLDSSNGFDPDHAIVSRRS
ncbi:MAG: hypothetical protein A3E87_07415 [Gammaproteobacteria bacterium RIFCSPHIGHO2_12_FULL_35_23]|nr:MAG: hypothetical protein A3E87_07415 [Gammaproteobacteria bacterium RIFCSPHIGHO2_12_FULL_35_23]